MGNSKFDSVFFRKKFKQVKAPKALKKKLNLEAPKGYSYELMEGTEDMYVLRSVQNPEANTFQLRIKFPFKFEGMDIHNLNELTEAMYRTQKSFKLDQSLQNDPPTIIHLGSTGITEQFIGSIEKFPVLEPIEVEVGEKKILLPVERVPYPSLTEIKIVSQSDFLIDFEMLLNEETSKISMTVKINYDCLKTLDDYFNNIDIIESFYTVGIKIFKKSLAPDDNQARMFQHNHDFFEALKNLQNYFSVSFDFPHKIDNDDIYYTKVLFESFINHRMVAIKNQNQISFSFDKEKLNSSMPNELESGVKIGIVRPREIISLELFGVELQFLEYTVYPIMTFKKILDSSNEEVEMIFDLPEESSHYVLFSSDSIDDFDMATTGQNLFELTNNAVAIQDVNFSKLSLPDS